MQLPTAGKGVSRLKIETAQCVIPTLSISKAG